MKSYRKELWFNIPARRAFINITPQVNECLRESEIREGLLLCMPCTLPHRFLSMMMSRVFIRITKDGSKNLLPMNPFPDIYTTGVVKTTETPT